MGSSSISSTHGSYPEFNEAYTTLTLKPGKNPELVDSYPHISLLNKEYKLLTKLIKIRRETPGILQCWTISAIERRHVR